MSISSNGNKNSSATMECERGEYLFDPAILNSPTRLNGVHLRPLQQGDYARGFCNVLSQLTESEFTAEMFLKRFEDMKKYRDTYFVVVGEHEDTGRIVCSATVVIELKFIHGASAVGHIEDVVVAEEMRGQHIGEAMISQLQHIALNHYGCYKVILDCSENFVGFYSKCNMKTCGLEMSVYKRDLNKQKNAQ